MKKILAFFKKHIITFVKGIAMGASMGIPGMSGGTTAIILRIYDKMLNALNTFFKKIKENLLFLTLIVIGGGLGFLLSYFSIMKAVERFPAVSAYFFSGIILFGIPALIKESGITYKGEKFITGEKSTRKKKIFTAILMDLIPFIAGLLVVVGMGLLQNAGFLNASDYTGSLKYLFFILAGFFAGIAFILPGLSFTYFLLLIGLMGESGLNFMAIGLLLIFILGLVISIILTARVLDKLIKKRKRGTYACIIGFLIGSVIMLLTDRKYIPATRHIGFCALFFALGATLILSITFLANKLSKKVKTAENKTTANAAVNIETDKHTTN